MQGILAKTENIIKLRNYSPKTRKSYLIYIREYIKFAQQHNLTNKHEAIEKFLLAKQKRKQSPQTINLALNSIKFFYREVLQSKDKIESLLLSNKISLPSKSPYYSLSSIFSLYNITISLSILFRIVEDQYDRFMLGLELPYNTPVKNLGSVLPILHVYVATCYAFQKMFGDGVLTTFTQYNCYDGIVDYLGDPPVPHNLSNLTEIYEELITRPISRDDRTTRIQSIVDDWSRPMSQNFLNSINASEPLLDALNPEFKTIIDSWFDTGDESYLITYLIGTLDNWIRLNVDSKSPSLVITMLGLGFRKELYEILNFFKPYRARLAFMDTAFSFKNPLTESIRLDYWCSYLPVIN